MKYIKQDGGPTCGVACYAMITGVTFKEAHKKIKKRMNNHGLKTRDMVAAFRAAKHKIVGSGRLRPVGKKLWNDLPSLSLVKVRPDDCPMHHWHWVVWDGKKIYDPATGIKTSKKYDNDPISFVEIN